MRVRKVTVYAEYPKKLKKNDLEIRWELGESEKKKPFCRHFDVVFCKKYTFFSK